MNAITQNRSIGGADLIAPILFIHGSLGSSAQWQETIDALNSDAPVMSIDLSGYGRNGPWLSERPISLAEEAMVVLRPLGRQVRRLHIVGHGFGAAVALKIAELWPERITSLVLIEPISVFARPGAECRSRPDRFCGGGERGDRSLERRQAGRGLRVVHRILERFRGMGHLGRGCPPAVDCSSPSFAFRFRGLPGRCRASWRRCRIGDANHARRRHRFTIDRSRRCRSFGACDARRQSQVHPRCRPHAARNPSRVARHPPPAPFWQSRNSHTQCSNSADGSHRSGGIAIASRAPNGLKRFVGWCKDC